MSCGRLDATEKLGGIWFYMLESELDMHIIIDG
jgi:hypothetical protein